MFGSKPSASAISFANKQQIAKLIADAEGFSFQTLQQ